MYAAAPSFRNCRSLLCGRLLNTTIGILAVLSVVLSDRITSGPDNLGSNMSKRTRSGGCSQANLRASSPSRAVTTREPARTKALSLKTRRNRLSSTRRIVFTVIPVLLRQHFILHRGRWLNSLILQLCYARHQRRFDPQQYSYPRTEQSSEESGSRTPVAIDV